jgi:hypothetical protein
VDGGAVLQLDGDRLVVQLHQEPAAKQTRQNQYRIWRKNFTKQISEERQSETNLKEEGGGGEQYLTSFIVAAAGRRKRRRTESRESSSCWLSRSGRGETLV